MGIVVIEVQGIEVRVGEIATLADETRIARIQTIRHEDAIMPNLEPRRRCLTSAHVATFRFARFLSFRTRQLRRQVSSRYQSHKYNETYCLSRRNDDRQILRYLDRLSARKTGA